MSEKPSHLRMAGRAIDALADARDVDARYEVRRLCNWFDDKFHGEVTSKLLYERVNRKVQGTGYPDSKAVKSGATRIRVSP